MVAGVATADESSAFYINSSRNYVKTSTEGNGCNLPHHLESIHLHYDAKSTGNRGPLIFRDGLTRGDNAEPTFKIAVQYRNDQQPTPNTWEYLYSNYSSAPRMEQRIYS